MIIDLEKLIRSIFEVVKKDVFFAEKPTYQGAIALSYSLMILVQNFMLINNHLKTWV